MIVGADGKVAPRQVKVGSVQDGQWVVLDGLKAGEQVMVDGFQKLRGAAPVKPVPWTPGGGTGEGRAAGRVGDGPRQRRFGSLKAHTHGRSSSSTAQSSRG